MVLMCLCRFLFVFMDSMVSLCVLIGPSLSLWILMGPYRVFMRFYEALQVVKQPYGF